jgi:hypothetical protein
MGKKPLVAIVGLIWAGMALVGCENCKNCRPKYNVPPTFPMKTGAPVGTDPATSSVVTPTVGVGGVAGKAESTKTADAPGTKGFAPESPAVGLPVSTGPTPGGPTTQSLSPSTDPQPVGMPGRGQGYLSGVTPPSGSGPADGMPRVPLRPVTTVGGTTPGGSTQALPAIAPTSNLPPSPLGSSIPPAPLPSMGNNTMPMIDTPSR